MAEHTHSAITCVSGEVDDQMLSLVGFCEGGPTDLADRHDWYLYQQFDSENKCCSHAREAL